MSPEDIKKLLGGYATGTLTPDAQQALFAAALEDQELFDALAREQSLRDLLRDPAARAELLSALEAPAPRPVGFWQWLRRPVVAGLEAAGVAAIAMVAVWQGTRMASVSHQAQPVIVAELKRPELSPVPSTAQLLAPASQPATNKRDKDAGASATVLADKEIAPSVAPPSRRLEADSAVELLKQKKAVIAIAPSPPQAEENMRAQIAPATAEQMADNKAAAAMLPPPPPPPAVPAAMPAVLARKAEVDAAPPAPTTGLTTGAVQANLSLDARALFYLDQAAPVANAFVQPGGVGGAAPPPTFRGAPRKDAPATKARGATATAPRLGLRVSVLRGQSEVDLATVLDPGRSEEH